MGLPCVVNGATFVFTRGSDPPQARAFGGGSPVTKAAGNPLVTTASTCGGMAFTASAVSSVAKADGNPLVLVGAVITCADGYVGTTTAANAAGTFLQAT